MNRVTTYRGPAVSGSRQTSRGAVIASRGPAVGSARRGKVLRADGEDTKGDEDKKADDDAEVDRGIGGILDEALGSSSSQQI
ncbi:MAG: hypothetical protein ACRDQU_17480 [Pseudonocardiaceae bacterium]